MDDPGVELLEKQLRDYLTDKFMEERINVVKKTTNWLHNISGVIKATMQAKEKEVERQLDGGMPPLKDEIEGDLREQRRNVFFDPAR